MVKKWWHCYIHVSSKPGIKARWHHIFLGTLSPKNHGSKNRPILLLIDWIISESVGRSRFHSDSDWFQHNYCQILADSTISSWFYNIKIWLSDKQVCTIGFHRLLNLTPQNSGVKSCEPRKFYAFTKNYKYSSLLPASPKENLRKKVKIDS